MASLFAALVHLALAAATGEQAPSAVPPPVPQRTTACAAIVYATDTLVCRDNELREADRALAELYATADHAGVVDGGAYLETATDWFRRRSLCAFSPDHRECVVAAYRERTAVMQALLAARDGPVPLEVTCQQNRWRGSWIRTSQGLAVIVLADEHATPVGVAFDGGNEPGWLIYLAAESAGHQMRLSRGDERVDCALSTELRDVSDLGLRDRVEAVDALLANARAAHAGHRLDEASYAAVLQWLRDQEIAVHAEARLRTFSDLTVHNYWHRSRLKFPTATEQEIDRLGVPLRR